MSAMAPRYVHHSAPIDQDGMFQERSDVRPCACSSSRCTGIVGRVHRQTCRDRGRDRRIERGPGVPERHHEQQGEEMQRVQSRKPRPDVRPHCASPIAAHQPLAVHVADDEATEEEEEVHPHVAFVQESGRRRRHQAKDVCIEVVNQHPHGCNATKWRERVDVRRMFEAGRSRSNAIGGDEFDLRPDDGTHFISKENGRSTSFTIASISLHAQCQRARLQELVRAHCNE